MKTRAEAGATLALVVTCTLIIVVIGVAFFFLSRIVGGERELQGAVDAGNLNLAKQALVGPGVNSTGIGGLNGADANEAQFLGVADTAHGNAINLNNINRVMALSMLVAANAKAMDLEGTNTGTTDSHAQAVENTADAIATQLATKLADQGVMANVFSGVTSSNSIRMLKADQNQTASDVAHGSHTVAYADRGAAGNVRFIDSQFPSKVSSTWTATRGANALQISGLNGYYMKGYSDGIHFLDRDIHFVPLKDSSNTGDTQRFRTAQPHLISQQTFANNSSPGTGSSTFTWANAVPNAFQDRGDAQERVSATMAQLASSSQSLSMQPADGFYAAIPRGFIRIKNNSCTNGSGSSGGSTQDIFTFLMNNPQVASTGAPGPHYQKATDPYLGNIIAANAASNPPSPSDCGALKPPANTADCAQINGQTGIIDNNNYTSSDLSAISSAYGIGSGGGGTQTGCANALELANLDLLTQRSSGADGVQIGVYNSGVAYTNGSRGSLSNGSYQFMQAITLSQALTNAPSTRARIIQRCYEIFPFFNGDLNTVVGYNSAGIPMGATAYIFFNGSTDPATGQMTGNLVLQEQATAFATAPWLATVGGLSSDGTSGAYDVDKMSHSGMNSIINVSSDWGFPQPYDFYSGNTPCQKNTYIFTPSTGYRGLLGDLQMGSCMGSGACAAAPGDHGDAAAGGFSAPAFSSCSGGPGPWDGPC